MIRAIFVLGWATLSGMAMAQAPLRLSLQDAIALATSKSGSSAVQLADAAEQAARARVSLTRAYRLPLLEITGSVSNVTRNLGAEGFNFPTGVPGFVIPNAVGPFNIYDTRIQMTQTIFDLSAIRQARGVVASLAGAHADTLTRESVSATRVAHDYLVALRANATIATAKTTISQAETIMHTAQDRVDSGKASDIELDEARLRLATSHRSLAAAQNAGSQAMLELANDLGLSFDTPVELTDHLAAPHEATPEIADAVALAMRTRPELQTAAFKQTQAQDNARSISAQRLPTVTAYGDVGPQSSVITHTVGVSARITVFDGGRLKAQQAESDAAVRQSEIQQKDLRRQIELQVREAVVNLTSAMAQAADCDEAATFAKDQLLRIQRRLDNGVATTAELGVAQERATQAEDTQAQAYFAWQQARIDLAAATGTANSLTMQ